MRPPCPCSSSRPWSGLGSGFLSCDICHHLALSRVAEPDNASVKDGGLSADVDRLPEVRKSLNKVFG